MKFSPQNAIVRLSIQGMGLEEAGRLEDARALFLRAWGEATDDHERLLAAYHVSRLREDPADRLSWLEVALRLAQTIDDVSVAAAVPFLQLKIAEHHESQGDLEAAERARERAAELERAPTDRGPFYHGTRADLAVGDLLTAGNLSNYETGLVMNHIYFTAQVEGAGLAAALSRGEGHERVYLVEPTGRIEDDPNVTNKRFPGNLTRSYRSEAPLKIIGEATDWERPPPEVIRKWRERLAKSEGGIIN